MDKKERDKRIAWYSDKMAKIANRYVDGSTNRVYKFLRDSTLSYGLPLIVMNTSIFLFKPSAFFGNAIYHVSGFLGALLLRILDYKSSLKFVEEYEDGKFWEYGLDKVCKEGNPILKPHPSKRDLIFSKRSLLTQLIVFIGGTTFPPFGHGSASYAKLLHDHNIAVSKKIRIAKKIGDKVKEKFENGATDFEVNEFLSNLYQNPKLLDELTNQT